MGMSISYKLISSKIRTNGHKLDKNNFLLSLQAKTNYHLCIKDIFSSLLKYALFSKINLPLGVCSEYRCCRTFQLICKLKTETLFTLT